MPELPEVEVTRQGLLSRLPGRKVLKVTLSGKRLRSTVPRKLLNGYISDNTFDTIDRRAKYLLFRMVDDTTMVIHLGMTGKLGLIPSRESPAKHDHLRLSLNDGMDLRFNDSRRFGSISVWPPMEAAKMEKTFSDRLGVEPFSKKYNVYYLKKKSLSRSIPVKSFLMDATIVVGIGNIYANEILFASSIDPHTPAKSIEPGQWKSIISSTRRILKKAIQAGGSTISDFLSSSGNPGYFQVHFNVYNCGGDKCRRCKNIIQKTVISGRATFFCPQCQRVTA